MRHSIFSLCIYLLSCCLPIASAQTRIKPSDMTLEEKIHMLTTCDLGIERLGVPTSFYSEGMHGIAYGGPSNWGAYKPLPTTTFPQAYGLGQTWDPELLERIATHISTEQRYYFQNPVYDRAGLIIWGPNVDLSRDPRWGRTDESYGEDPWLISQMGMAYVRGAKGPDPDHWRSSPLLKHFFANSYEERRHVSSSDVPERLMREYYTYTFWKCITEAGCRGIMPAYNDVDSIPMTVHPLLRKLAVEEWGMDGIVCSDQDAMSRMVRLKGYYDDYAVSAAESIKAGITQFLSDEKEDSDAAVREAIARGLVSEDEIDEAIQRNLNVMEKLGLLGGQDPYAGIGRDGAGQPCLTPEAAELCREAVVKSAVLLKNKGILPLKADKIHKIAVIGPHVDTVLQDWYGGTPPYRVSLLEGVRNAVGEDVEIVWEKYDFAGTGVRMASEADVVIVEVGNNPVPCLDLAGGGAEIGWSRSQVISDGMEEVDRQSLMLADEDIVKMMLQANPNVVMVLASSGPYTIGWSKEHVPAILQITHGSMEFGNGIADILFGKANPAGRLSQTWPQSIEDLPPMWDYDITRGRTYMYSRATPLFPFGYGLSYSRFKYSGMKVSRTSDGWEVSLDVYNRGTMDGDEVIQIYVQYPGSKVPRPLKQLRGFKRVSIPAGQKVRVTIPIADKDLCYWDVDKHAWALEKGRVRFLAGASSTDIRCKKTRRIR